MTELSTAQKKKTHTHVRMRIELYHQLMKVAEAENRSVIRQLDMMLKEQIEIWNIRKGGGENGP